MKQHLRDAVLVSAAVGALLFLVLFGGGSVMPGLEIDPSYYFLFAAGYLPASFFIVFAVYWLLLRVERDPEPHFTRYWLTLFGCTLLFFAALISLATIYSRMDPAPGDPEIDQTFLFFSLVIWSLATSAVLAVACFVLAYLSKGFLVGGSALVLTLGIFCLAFITASTGDLPAWQATRTSTGRTRLDADTWRKPHESPF